MKMRIPYFPALLLIILIGFSMCKKDEEIKMPLIFSGQVVDQEDIGIPEALIEVGEKNTQTDEQGFFKLVVDSTDRYVLNITKLGFGLVSKIYAEPDSTLFLSMTTATVDTIEIVEPDQEIVIEDTTPPPPESVPPSSEITTIGSPVDTIAFVYNPAGRLIAFGAPPPVAETYDAAEDFETPDGATVEVNADDLTDTGGGGGSAAFASFFPQDKKDAEERMKGKIIGSLSTVDLYSPDGMPGDFTIINNEGNSRWMVPFGAAEVNFYRDGEKQQLKEGKYATLTIPVDPIAHSFYGEKLREKIPLWIYDKNSGLWQRDIDRWTKEEVWGELNREKTAYVARVSHFSVYNMDEEFSTPSCTRLLNSNSAPDLIPNTYQIEVAVPGHINMFPFGSGCLDDCGAIGFNVHAIARMQQNQPIGMRIFDNAGVIQSTYVLTGGAPSVDVIGAACGDPEYCSCDTEITISNDSPPYMNTNGTMNKPLVAVDESGTDLRVSWIYVPEVSGTDYTTTTPRTYTIEVANDAGFTTIVGSQVVGPNTDWLNSELIPMLTIDTWIDGAGTNTDSHYIRVKAEPGTGTPFPVDSDPAVDCFFHPDSGSGSDGDGGLEGC